jgi:hypothetical protein
VTAARTSSHRPNCARVAASQAYPAISLKGLVGSSALRGPLARVRAYFRDALPVEPSIVRVAPFSLACYTCRPTAMAHQPKPCVIVREASSLINNHGPARTDEASSATSQS